MLINSEKSEAKETSIGRLKMEQQGMISCFGIRVYYVQERPGCKLSVNSKEYVKNI